MMMPNKQVFVLMTRPSSSLPLVSKSLPVFPTLASVCLLPEYKMLFFLANIQMSRFKPIIYQQPQP